VGVVAWFVVLGFVGVNCCGWKELDLIYEGIKKMQVETLN
jgi:hypothetical protein